MKDVRINNRMQRVFVLKETKDRMVYIPIKSLHIVDYHRLLEIEKLHGDKMLEGMKKSRLDNGINALVQYDNLIQVMEKNGEREGIRITKPEEGEVKKMSKERDAELEIAKSQETKQTAATPPVAVQEEQQQKRPYRRRTVEQPTTEINDTE